MSCLSDLVLPGGSQLLIYVDDLLVASKTEQAYRVDSLTLFHHLHKTGKQGEQKQNPVGEN